MDNNFSEKEDPSILSILQDIKDGILDPRSIDKATRKEVVNFLRIEGHTVATIAQILKCSDKTIQRVISDIKKDNQVTTNPGFIQQMIGEMCRAGFQHWGSLVRITRSPISTIREKIDAETAAWIVLRDLIEQLRRVGYLPSATQEVVHHLDATEEKSWQEIQVEVFHLEQVAKQTNVLTPELANQLSDLNRKIEKAVVVDNIQTIISKENINEEDNQNEQK